MHVCRSDAPAACNDLARAEEAPRGTDRNIALRTIGMLDVRISVCMNECTADKVRPCPYRPKSCLVKEFASCAKLADGPRMTWPSVAVCFAPT